MYVNFCFDFLQIDCQLHVLYDIIENKENPFLSYEYLANKNVIWSLNLN